ncbi:MULTISPECIES: Hpt domain-containing protein [unclassified Thioalkalivibrio]|uniref:Hpt domain-containing protein n=1 Tax=unclassified Thioalkalivibrio TaxID=2621013 RepID=UPI0003765045|nr:MULTISPECIES: Hpt domain-containing protein [unclassified Thioalkalivibrio]
MASSALNWVRDELLTLFGEVQESLRHYSENMERKGDLAEARARVEQIRNTLVVVQVDNGVLICDEMIQVFGHLEQLEGGDWAATEALLRASMQLPDYLDSESDGLLPSPMNLAPVLTDLRASRGAPLLLDAASLVADAPSLKDDVIVSEGDGLPPEARIGALQDVRRDFQRDLLTFVRDDSPEGAAVQMQESMKAAVKLCPPGDPRQLFWIADALFECVARGELKVGTDLRRVVGHIDRDLKRYIEILKEHVEQGGGASEPEYATPNDLTKTLLFHVASARSEGEQSRAVRRAFGLNDDAEHVGREVYDSLRQAIEEDLSDLRERMDILLRSPQRNVDDLEAIQSRVSRIGSTFSILGSDEGRDLTDKLTQALSPDHAGEASGQHDMVLAEHLLALESLLEAGLHRRSASGSRDETGFDESLATVIYKEALSDVRQVRDTFLSFLSSSAGSESGDGLSGAIEGLRRIMGAMSMSGFETLHALLAPLTQYLDQRAPQSAGDLSEDEIEALAEVLISIEVALESSGQPWRELDSVHERGIEALQRLGAISVAADGQIAMQHDTNEGASDDHGVEAEIPEVDDAVETLEAIEITEVADGDTEIEGVADAGSELEAAPEDDALASPVEEASDALEAEALELPADPAIDESAESVEATDEPPKGRGLSDAFNEEILSQEVRGLDADLEILEIFIEEADEEVAGLGENFPRWKSNPSDLDTLAVIRRSFHTLKGSGRLAGALRLGEFAWVVESYMNRILEQKAPVDADCLQAIEDAVSVLPGLVDEVRANAQPTVPILDIALRLSALIAGERIEATPSPKRDTAAAPVEPEGDAGMEKAEEGLDVADSKGEGGIEADKPGAEEQEDRADLDNAVSDLESEAELDDLVAECSIGAEEGTQIETENVPESSLEAPDASGFEVSFESVDLGEEELSVDDEQATETSEALESAVEHEIDEQLWAVFCAEAQVHLLTLRSWLDDAAMHPDRIPNNDVERALHTLHGSARTAEVGGVSAVCGPFERIVRIHRDVETPLSSEAVGLLCKLESYVTEVVANEEPDLENVVNPPGWAGEVFDLLDQASAIQVLNSCDSMEAQLARYEDAFSAEDPASSSELPEAGSDDAEAGEVAAPALEADHEIEQCPAAEPEQAPEASGDPECEIDWEFGEVFIEEAADILEGAFESLGGWRDSGGLPGPDQNTFQREIHTLKGSARMAGFTVVGAIAHALESAMSIEAERDPREGFFPLIERALMDVQQLVERGIGSWQMDEASSQSLMALREWADGNPDSGADATVADEDAVTSEAEAEGEHADDAGQAEDSGSAQEDVSPAKSPSGEGRRLQEQVRMDADTLDALIGNAGELSTFHRRFEQGIGRVESQAEELGRTIARLREQLRKLEIETEAQILFRVEEESGDEAIDFDPLEMDRYSGIQQLSRSLAESVSDLEALKQDVGNELQSAGAVLLQQRRIGTDLQDQLMRQRMVRFSRMVPRLQRVVSQAGQDLSKPVRIEFTGQGAELDRALLERLVPPMEHLLRNAIAHGIEDKGGRSKAKKPNEGLIRVSLNQSGGEIRLQVEDDGKGIDAEAIRRRAVERGLLASDAEISDAQALQLILQPGFSTASEVSQVAGRGVGLDVVNSDVKQLGGTLDIHSTPGEGSRFTMRLPFTLAISQALLVQVGEETFAVPLGSVQGVVRGRKDEIEYESGSPVYSYAGQDFTVRGLGELMGVESQATADDLPDHAFPMLLVNSDEGGMALRVDALHGSQEVVVKSVGPVLSRIPGVAGATLQGDGSVMLILDLGMLMRFATASMAESIAAGSTERAPQATKAPDTRRVMVVDDSITIRKVTARLLSRHGFDVVTARDGLDALGMLEEQRPDVILLDVEMPRMDGFEFATHVREHAELGATPIIMITSRSGSKHRDRAERIGVNDYLGKPYLEGDLMSSINEQLEGVSA